jgi:hypothetical protein
MTDDLVMTLKSTLTPEQFKDLGEALYNISEICKRDPREADKWLCFMQGWAYVMDKQLKSSEKRARA